jgi:hypothetical protein
VGNGRVVYKRVGNHIEDEEDANAWFVGGDEDSEVRK